MHAVPSFFVSPALIDGGSWGHWGSTTTSAQSYPTGRLSHQPRFHPAARDHAAKLLVFLWCLTWLRTASWSWQ